MQLPAHIFFLLSPPLIGLLLQTKLQLTTHEMLFLMDEKQRADLLLPQHTFLWLYLLQQLKLLLRRN